MRALVAVLAAAVALACAAYLQTMSYVGGAVLDSDRFAETTLGTLSGPEGSAAAAAVLTDALEARTSARGLTVPEATLARVREALTAALRRPGAVEALRPAVARAHRELIDSGGEPSVSLAPLHPQVVAAVNARAPAAAALVPPASAFPVISVPVAWQDAGPLELAGPLRDGKGTALLVGLAALVLAIALSRRRGGALVVIGACVVALAALPWLVRGGGAWAAGLIDPDGDDPLADALVAGFTDGWLRAAALTAVAGVAMIVVGVAARGRPG
jgi:hypothetical protein